jgi:hypothetical protein
MEAYMVNKRKVVGTVFAISILWTAALGFNHRVETDVVKIRLGGLTRYGQQLMEPKKLVHPMNCFGIWKKFC